jgi:hypothetical protein
MPADGSRVGDRKSVGDDQNTDGVDYDGPIVAAAGPGGPGAGGPWIWIANGTNPSMFVPPVVRRPPPPPPPEGFSADRIIESFRAEALGLDEYDPYVDEILDDEEFGVEESEVEERPTVEVISPTSAPEILLLGSVEAHGWSSPPERAVVVELACYLALHRERPVSGESLRSALRPDGSKEQSAKTLRTYLSMLRKALGPDALPSRPSGGYQLASWVTTDWERFVELSQSDDVDDGLEALSLIRGRPFEGVPSGTYAWAFSEFLVSEMEVAVASLITRVVDQLVNEGDLERALSAVRQGLRAVAGDYGLWELYLSMAAQAGPTALSRARSEARAALGDDAPPG